jgi:hypothetical protein
MDKTFENLLRFECPKWVQVLVLKFHVSVSPYSIFRAYVLLSIKLWDLSSIVLSFILWGTLLLIILMIYKLGLNVPHKEK